MQIFIGRNNQQLGPFDLATIQAQLNEGSLAPSDLAWYEGAAGWAPLSTVPGIVIAPPAPQSSPPAPPAVPPIPPLPVQAPSPSGVGPIPPAQPQKKSGLKLVGSILLGLLILGLGVIKIVRTSQRLFKSEPKTHVVSAPSSTQKPSTPAPSATQKTITQNTDTQSVPPQTVAQLKTVSYPPKKPLISFQLPKDAETLEKDGTVCFRYGSFVCVSGDVKETSTFEDTEIKEAEQELTKAMISTITEVLQKQGGTGIHVNKTGHFKTAKGETIFYSEATYKNAQGADMVFLNHLLPSKKGMFVFQGYGRQTEKDAFYKEMRRLLDSVSL